MTVNELAKLYGLPLSKMRKLHAAGYLKCEAGDDRPARMRAYLSSSRPLSVVQLIELLREPDGELFAALAPYQERAREQMIAVGDLSGAGIDGAQAPALIYGAAISDKRATETLVAWLKDTIPARGCSYHYVAVRMLWNVKPADFARAYNFLPRAIINLRAHAELAGWSIRDNKGTRFFRPKSEQPLDL